MSVSQRNSCEALLAFVWVIVEYITVGGLQVLASYSSLYPAIIRSLEPFTPDLFRAFGGLTNETKHIDWSSLIWRLN